MTFVTARPLRPAKGDTGLLIHQEPEMKSSIGRLRYRAYLRQSGECYYCQHAMWVID